MVKKILRGDLKRLQRLKAKYLNNERGLWILQVSKLRKIKKKQTNCNKSKFRAPALRWAKKFLKTKKG